MIVLNVMIAAAMTIGVVMMVILILVAAIDAVSLVGQGRRWLRARSSSQPRIRDK
jgi:hypothetical protein